MRVYIHGPNLYHQELGQFHVHAEGCNDNGKYGPGRYWGGDQFESAIEVNSKEDVVEYIYGDFENYDPTDDINDFYFAPCTWSLPVGVVK
jgi:hypothetical protein